MTRTKCVGCVRCVRCVWCVWWVLLLAGCGSKPPTSPSTLTLSGTWTGKFEYVTGGVTVSEDATLLLNQSSTTASGSWNGTSGSSGTLSLTLNASTTGAFTISQPNLGSAACTGSSTVSGTASATDLVVNVAELVRTPTCPWASAMKFTLHK
jgi:hypothetical protein